MYSWSVAIYFESLPPPLRCCHMRIAMCDDEPIILDELQKFCTACYKRAGISPTWLVSSDPNCFIDELEAFAPELILLDIDMPRLTGFDNCCSGTIELF